MGSSDARSLGTFSSVSVFPVKRAGRLPAGSGAPAEGRSGKQGSEWGREMEWGGGHGHLKLTRMILRKPVNTVSQQQGEPEWSPIQSCRRGRRGHVQKCDFGVSWAKKEGECEYCEGWGKGDRSSRF